MAPLLLAASLTALTPVAHAVPVLWTLTDVLFDDGGTATGSFTFDADTNAYSSVSITASGGFFATSSYASLLAGGSGDAALIAGLALPPLTGEPLLQLVYEAPLTNAGGLVGLVNYSFPANSSFQATCLDAGCFSANIDRMMVDGGLIGAVVPIPAAGVLLPTALAMLGLARRRKTAAA